MMTDPLPPQSSKSARSSPANSGGEDGSVGKGETGLVSVIIPVYNRPVLLRRALNSVVKQSYEPIEAVVVDDGSTDETPRVVHRMSASEPICIRHIRQPHRGVVAATRNRGLRESRGEYIQFLDSDDFLGSTKIDLQVRALRRQPELDFAWCATLFAGATRSRGVSFSWMGREDLLAHFVRRPLWQTGAPLYRRSTCERVGPWNEDLNLAEDWEYGVRLLAGDPESRRVSGARTYYVLHSSGHVSAEWTRQNAVGEYLKVTRAGEDALRTSGRLQEANVRAGLAIRYVEGACWAAAQKDISTCETALEKASELSPNRTDNWRPILLRSLSSALGPERAARLWLHALGRYRQFDRLLRLIWFGRSPAFPRQDDPPPRAQS